MQRDPARVYRGFVGTLSGTATVSGVTLVASTPARLFPGPHLATHDGQPPDGAPLVPDVRSSAFNGQRAIGAWSVNVSGIGLSDTNVGLVLDLECP